MGLDFVPFGRDLCSAEPRNRRQVSVKVGCSGTTNLAYASNDVYFYLKLLEKSCYNVVLPDVQLFCHESKTRGYEDNDEKRERLQYEANVIAKRWSKNIEKSPFYNPKLTL